MFQNCYPDIDIEIDIEIDIDFVVRSRLPLPLHRSVLKQQAFVSACHGSGAQRATDVKKIINITIKRTLKKQHNI